MSDVFIIVFYGHKMKNNLVNIPFDMYFKYRDCRSLRKPNQFQYA